MVHGESGGVKGRGCMKMEWRVHGEGVELCVSGMGQLCIVLWCSSVSVRVYVWSVRVHVYLVVLNLHQDVLVV